MVLRKIPKCECEGRQAPEDEQRLILSAGKIRLSGEIVEITEGHADTVRRILVFKTPTGEVREVPYGQLVTHSQSCPLFGL